MNVGTQLSIRSQPDQNSRGECGIRSWAYRISLYTGCRFNRPPCRSRYINSTGDRDHSWVVIQDTKSSHIRQADLIDETRQSWSDGYGMANSNEKMRITCEGEINCWSNTKCLSSQSQAKFSGDCRRAATARSASVFYHGFISTPRI